MNDQSVILLLLMIRDRLDCSISKLEEELPSELEIKEKSSLTGHTYSSFPILDDLRQFSGDLERYIKELKDA